MRRVLSLAGFFVLAACAVVPPPPTPPPPPPPAPAPPPPPPPRVVVEPEKPWDVAPLTQGDWRYRRDQAGTAALFGPPGQTSLEIICRTGTRQIAISRIGSRGQAATMTIRTSSGDLQWPAQPSADGLGTVATRPAGDSGLDWIAYSRGRISLEVPGLARLILPVWAEISRVIEDCRG